jgi:hypothetical protein
MPANPSSRPGDLDPEALTIARHQPHLSFLPRRWEDLKTDPDTSCRRQREGLRLFGLLATDPMTDLPTGDYGDSEHVPPDPMVTHQPAHPPSWADWSPPDTQASPPAEA